MPAVKMVPIHDEEGNVVDRRFEASNSFAAAAAKNRMPMFRADGKPVNVNRKLQARGHYDDRHGFITPEQHRLANARPTAAVKREENGK